AVFAGEWTLEAAEAVCADEVGASPRLTRAGVLDILTQLVTKSLVLAGERHGETRYHLLETIRQYAREQLLESGEAERVRNSHLDFYLQMAEQAETHFYGPEQEHWFEHLERVHDNLRAALEWSLQSRNGIAALRLAAALTR